MTAEARQTVKTALEALEGLTVGHWGELEAEELERLTLAEELLHRVLEDCGEGAG